MTPFVTAGGGFLLAVLWFDLMFDVHLLRSKGGPSAEAMDSITAYYGRVTGGAKAMSMLIAAAMVGSLASLVIQAIRDEVPGWLSIVSLATAGLAVGLAAVHTVPTATRLGERRDPLDEQVRLARAVLRDHLVEIVAVTTLLVLQLCCG